MSNHTLILASPKANEVQQLDRGVQFIPGVPGHHKLKKMPKPQTLVKAEEVEYYQKRNKELFEAEAKAARKSAGKFIHRGDIQADLSDENVELGNNGMNQDMQAPIYRGDYNGIRRGPEAEERPPYVPKHRMIHLVKGGKYLREEIE